MAGRLTALRSVGAMMRPGGATRVVAARMSSGAKKHHPPRPTGGNALRHASNVPNSPAQGETISIQRAPSKTDQMSWATVDPDTMSGANPAKVQNLLAGQWETDASQLHPMVDPLNGETFLLLPCVEEENIGPWVKSMQSTPKYGLHNPLLKPERYLKLGEVSQRIAQRMSEPEVEYFFARLIQRVCPKSWNQAMAEVRVTRNFLYNFSGDQVRFLARSFGHPGDHMGQNTEGHRWPYGPVAIIAPFNFPLEIPVLQLMGALYMGNRVTLKACSRVSIVMEQYMRLMHECGLPMRDVDFINTWGPVMGKLLKKGGPRMTQFTGSTAVAEMLMADLHGKVKMEGGGFDWKVLGPDAPDPSKKEDKDTYDMVIYQCDQDAYACTGQKCSAQSILFVHENWAKKTNIYEDIKKLADKRNMEELTVGPTLSVPPEAIKAHLDKILAIPGAKLLFGGVEINEGNHSIPKCYGAMRPTAVFIPLDSMLSSPTNFRTATKEIFAPFQVVTEYKSVDTRKILSAIEHFDEFLTAAVVSNDPKFQQCILASSINGTTYVGMRARTTGAPQNHWFGPAGDPRSAGIGTPEAIRYTWSCHREIITDRGLLPDGWLHPEQS